MYVHTYIRMCMYVHVWIQRRMLSILLYDSPPYCLQAVSLAEPGARLPDSKSSNPPVSSPHSIRVPGAWWSLCGSLQGLQWFKLRSSGLCKKYSYPLGSPPASIFSMFNSCALRGRQKTYSVPLHAQQHPVLCLRTAHLSKCRSLREPVSGQLWATSQPRQKLA